EHARLVEAGLLAQQLELVVVAHNHERAGKTRLELGTRHAGALLPGIEDVPDAEHAALFRILPHRVGIVRRDDGEVSGPRRAERQLTGVLHRTRIERRDLVVRLIGVAEERRGELAGNLAYERR